MLKRVSEDDRYSPTVSQEPYFIEISVISGTSSVTCLLKMSSIVPYLDALFRPFDPNRVSRNLHFHALYAICRDNDDDKDNIVWSTFPTDRSAWDGLGFRRTNHRPTMSILKCSDVTVILRFPVRGWRLR